MPEEKQKLQLVTRTVEKKQKLVCECGAPIIVTDDNGSIGCSDECGWEGITLEPVAIVLTGDQIEWVG